MRTFACLIVLLTASAPASAERIERQDFDDGQTAHPFYSHTFEFDFDCCRQVVQHSSLKGLALYLVPNFDVVAVQTAPGEVVDSISITILDFEGGFVGDAPTSAVVVRGLSGDFVVLHAGEIGVAESVSIDRHAPGQLTGSPIGPIVEIDLQAANQGNSINSESGAYFDDLTVVVLDACPGDLDADRDVDIADLAVLLSNFGLTQGATFEDGDFDGDGSVDLGDLSALLSAFGQTCD